jgi:hypothetical protein
MSLETDTYTITTADGKYKIGRHVIEDKSLLPKNIVAFEQDDRVQTLVSYSLKSLVAGF